MGRAGLVVMVDASFVHIMHFGRNGANPKFLAHSIMVIQESRIQLSKVRSIGPPVVARGMLHGKRAPVHSHHVMIVKQQACSPPVHQDKMLHHHAPIILVFGGMRNALAMEVKDLRIRE